MIHGDGNRKLERAKNFREDHADAPAQRQGLRGIGLREQQSEFIDANAESGVRSTESFLESCRRCAQDFISARVAVLVVHFLEAMKIEDNQAQRMSVAASAVEFLVKIFGEEAAIVEAGEWIGDRVAMQILEVLVLEDYRNTKESGSGRHID